MRLFWVKEAWNSATFLVWLRKSKSCVCLECRLASNTEINIAEIATSACTSVNSAEPPFWLFETRRRKQISDGGFFPPDQEKRVSGFEVWGINCTASRGLSSSLKNVLKLKLRTSILWQQCTFFESTHNLISEKEHRNVENFVVNTSKTHKRFTVQQLFRCQQDRICDHEGVLSILAPLSIPVHVWTHWPSAGEWNFIGHFRENRKLISEMGHWVIAKLPTPDVEAENLMLRMHLLFQKRTCLTKWRCSFSLIDLSSVCRWDCVFPKRKVLSCSVDLLSGDTKKWWVVRRVMVLS